MDFTAFQENLKSLCDGSGKTQKSLAADIGIGPVALTRLIHGDRSPTIGTVIAVAEYFHVSIDWLLGYYPEKHEPLKPEQRNLLELYSLSSQDDRRVIDAVLSKYRKD